MADQDGGLNGDNNNAQNQDDGGNGDNNMPDAQNQDDGGNGDNNMPDAQNQDDGGNGDNNNANKRTKYTKRNFTEGGKISKTLRQGKDRYDTYLKRGKTLKANCEVLYELTHCHVRLNIIPTWPNGREHKYISPGYPLATPTPTPPSTPTSVRRQSPRKSPQKRITVRPEDIPSTSTTGLGATSGNVSRKKSKAHRYDKNKCNICGIVYGSDADLETEVDSNWCSCAGKNGKQQCAYWVHSACAGVYYEATSKGQAALDKWSQAHYFCPQHMPKE